MFTNITSNTDYKATYVAKPIKKLFYGHYAESKAYNGGTTTTKLTVIDESVNLKLLACPSNSYESPSKFGLEIKFEYGEYPNKDTVNVNNLEIINGGDVFSFSFVGMEMVLCANKPGDNQVFTVRHKPSGETITIKCDVRKPRLRLATKSDGTTYRPLEYNQWSVMTTVLCEMIDYKVGSQLESSSPSYAPMLWVNSLTETPVSNIPLEVLPVDDNAKIDVKLDCSAEGTYGVVYIYAKATVQNQLSNMQVYYTLFGEKIDLGIYKAYSL